MAAAFSFLRPPLWAPTTPSRRAKLTESYYCEGLAAYRARHWEGARRAFVAALESVPNDGPSMAFIKRIEGLATNPPDHGWDGSWQLEQK
jgi:hypothetical protein